MTEITAIELRSELAHFTGSEQMFSHSINRRFLYTEGVRHLAQAAGAYWFLDIAATELYKLQTKEPFLSIKLVVKGSKATIKVEDGNNNKVKNKNIQYTDFPEGEWLFFLTDNVMMLPSEY